MRARVWVELEGETRELVAERMESVEGIELVGFPPARARAIRDRLYAALAHRDGPLAGGVRIRVAPPLMAGAIGPLEDLLMLALRIVGRS